MTIFLDLSRMYRLLSRVNGLVPLRKTFEEYVEVTGLRSVATAQEENIAAKKAKAAKAAEDGEEDGGDKKEEEEPQEDAEKENGAEGGPKKKKGPAKKVVKKEAKEPEMVSCTGVVPHHYSVSHRNFFG